MGYKLLRGNHLTLHQRSQEPSRAQRSSRPMQALPRSSPKSLHGNPQLLVVCFLFRTFIVSCHCEWSFKSAIRIGQLGSARWCSAPASFSPQLFCCLGEKCNHLLSQRQFLLQSCSHDLLGESPHSRAALATLSCPHVILLFLFGVCCWQTELHSWIGGAYGKKAHPYVFFGLLTARPL